MAVLQSWHDADRAVALVLLHRLRRCGVEGALGLRHGLALRLGRRQVGVMRDWRRLGNLSALVIDNHLGKVVALHRIDGEGTRNTSASVIFLIVSSPGLRRDRCPTSSA